MHAITVAMKRAHWSYIRRTRRLFEWFGLTAARFDLMYVVDKWRGNASQSDLARELGVVGPVVSRMVKSLETKGFLTRTRSTSDRRKMLVSATPAGLQALRAAAFQLRELCFADRIVARMVKPALGTLADALFEVPADEETARAAYGREVYEVEAVDEIATLERSLDTVRGACGDGATIHYPWHPDD